MHYVYEFQGRKRLILAEEARPLFCVAVDGEVFELLRQAPQDRLKDLHEAVAALVREHVTRWQQREEAREEGLGEELGQASSELAGEL